MAARPPPGRGERFPMYNTARDPRSHAPAMGRIIDRAVEAATSKAKDMGPPSENDWRAFKAWRGKNRMRWRDLELRLSSKVTHDDAEFVGKLALLALTQQGLAADKARNLRNDQSEADRKASATESDETKTHYRHTALTYGRLADDTEKLQALWGKELDLIFTESGNRWQRYFHNATELYNHAYHHWRARVTDDGSIAIYGHSKGQTPGAPTPEMIREVMARLLQ